MKKVLILALVILGGCYYDNEEELYPNQPNDCDITNVTFSGTIFPIISDNCVICHSGSFPQNNISLTDHASIAAQAAILVGQPGSLYGAISHDPGNTAMPYQLPQLSDCKIKQVKVWIDSGMPDN